MGEPTHQSGGFDGGVVSIDGRTIDAQFGFNNGTATREVIPWELGLLKNGSNLTVRINGESAFAFSLNGSTAAILKIQEYSQRNDQAAETRPAPTPSQPRAQNSNCDVIAGGACQCKIKELKPNSGYIGAFRLEDSSGQNPSFSFQLLSEQHSDVWVSYSGGPWQFVGMWEQISQGSTVPSASQGPEALANLGQDAWQLCMR
jgi:hypothetical protein